MENEQHERRKDTDYDAYEADFMEETAAEIAVPASGREEHIHREHEVVGQDEGKGYGRFALILSILSLFFLPIILGAAGIILGFIARRKGANTLGAWAIGIGIVSIIVGTFILPFF
ncbi:hypothetical protein CHN50_06845 [Priestia aryabhattai]|uniref:DUF4190 domain-containing protein n=1 Tax=Bacillaceae TaxID=186817 RepID=UPI000BA0B88C|nr:DUF4190 domain-containing protein [Bacillus sp. CBEL-1]OZT13491.1 hypothetical protein CHN50_06845 [Priestia aryabhattai]TDB50799.1 DUF4190 domain-containing protein [Bacillus sp. CBEL-1]USY54495.1 DUF4190 domain-containing protein [Bacillus sp. 1780r2a1]